MIENTTEPFTDIQSQSAVYCCKNGSAPDDMQNLPALIFLLQTLLTAFRFSRPKS